MTAYKMFNSQHIVIVTSKQWVSPSKTIINTLTLNCCVLRQHWYILNYHKLYLCKNISRLNTYTKYVTSRQYCKEKQQVVEFILFKPYILYIPWWLAWYWRHIHLRHSITIYRIWCSVMSMCVVRSTSTCHSTATPCSLIYVLLYHLS